MSRSNHQKLSREDGRAGPDGHIHAILCAMHNQWRRALLLRGLSRLLLFMLAAWSVFGLIDAVFQLVFPARLLLALAIYAAIAGMSWRTWLKFWLRPYSPRSMAWVLESVYPDFHESLISAVELSEPGLAENGVSEDLIWRALTEAEAEVKMLAPRALFPVRWRLLQFPVAFAGVLLILSLFPGLEFPRRLARVAWPSASDASLGPSRLIVNIGPSIRDEGDTVYIRVRNKGGIPGNVELVVEGEKTERFVMDSGENRDWFFYALEDVTDDFRVWARSGNIRSATHRVYVRKRPRIESFTLTYRSPEYTGVPDRVETAETGDLQGLQGTRVTIVVKATQTLSGFSAVYNGERIASRSAPLGEQVAFDLVITRNGRYSVSLTNEQGLGNAGPSVFSVESRPDDPPVVLLTAPTSNQNLGLGDSLAVSWEASDDYGVAGQAVLLQTGGQFLLHQISLSPDQRSWTLIPEQLGLPPGGEVFLLVRVMDEAGQKTDSSPVKVIPGGGKILDDLDVYLTLCDQLELTLGRIDGELQAVETYSKYLNSLDNQAAGDPHYQLMLDRKVEEVRNALKHAQVLALSMKDRGTFPQNTHYVDLLKLYQEQEMLFSLAGLQQNEPEEALERLAKMVRLETEMTRALRQKARQQRLNILLPYKRQALASLDAEAGAPLLRERLAAYRAELEAAFPRLMQDFPKREKARSGTFAAVREQATEVLTKIERAAEQQFQNMRRLNRAATAIEKEIRGFTQQLRSLAVKLKLGASDEQWQAARDLADSYADIARADTNAIRRADAEPAAEHLLATITARDPQAMFDTADALTVLSTDNRLGQLVRELESARVTGRMLADDWNARTKARMETLLRQVGDLETEAKTLQELEDSQTLGRMSRAIADAARKLSEAIDDMGDSSSADEARGMLRNNNAALDRALDEWYQAVSDRRQTAEAARALNRFWTVSKSVQVEQLRQVLEVAGFELLQFEVSLATVTEKLTDAGKKLDQLARQYRDEVARDLVLERSPAERLVEKFILARVLDGLRQGELETARELLKEAASAETDPGNGMSAEVETAANRLWEAGESLAELADYALRHERAEAGRMPPAEQAIFYKQLAAHFSGFASTGLMQALETRKLFEAAAVDTNRWASLPSSEVSDAEKKASAVYTLRRQLKERIERLNPGFWERESKSPDGSQDGEAGLQTQIREAAERWGPSIRASGNTHGESGIPEDKKKELDRLFSELQNELKGAVSAKTELDTFAAQGQRLRDQAANTVAEAKAIASEESQSVMERLADRFFKADDILKRQDLLARMEKTFAGGSDMGSRLHRARLGLESVEEIEVRRRTSAFIAGQHRQKMQPLLTELAQIATRDRHGQSSHLFFLHSRLRANVGSGLYKAAMANLPTLKNAFENQSASDGAPVLISRGFTPRMTVPVDSKLYECLQAGAEGVSALEDFLVGAVAGGENGAMTSPADLEDAHRSFENAATLAYQAAMDIVLADNRTGPLPVLSAPEPLVESQASPFSSWNTLKEGMAGGDGTGGSTPYDAYYREANRAYLEKVSREGRKWTE